MRFIILLLSLFLVGCGQSGPLYLPSPPKVVKKAPSKTTRIKTPQVAKE
ncbi:MAG: lipoprotein [Pseudomonadota bacterium]